MDLTVDMTPQLQSNNDLPPTTKKSNVPTHAIVQRQLNDVIMVQKLAAERVKQDTTLCLKEKYVPKEVYDEAIRKFEKEKAEQYVSKQDYDDLKRRLETEQLDSLKTKTELDDVKEKLEFALGQIEVLTKQIEREKTAFQKSFNLLKLKTMKESNKNVALETKYTEIEKQKEQQEDVLEIKDREIRSLEQKLKAQDDIYQKQLGEMSVKLQQELYIAKTLGDQDKPNRGKTARHTCNNKTKKT